jgi:hypothetical protein
LRKAKRTPRITARLPTRIEKMSRSRQREPTLYKKYKIKKRPFPYKDFKKRMLEIKQVILNSARIMKIPKILNKIYIRYKGIIASIGSEMEYVAYL